MQILLGIGLALVLGDFGDEVLESVDEGWERFGARGIEALPFRDKNRFLSEYEELFADRSPGKRELKALARDLEDRLGSGDLEPGLVWRLLDLQCEVALDLERDKDATEHAWAAVDAYPPLRYADPDVHSSFQHLVARAVELEFEKTKPAVLADRVADAYAGQGAPAPFPTNLLVESFARAGGRSELMELSGRITALWSERAGEDAASAELYAGWLEELGGLEQRIPRVIGGDRHKLYHLLGDCEGPARLVIVLPGGTGRSDDFLSFVRGLQADLGEPYVFALVDAPFWNDEQASRVVWVRDHQARRFDARFGTEELVRSVYEDVLASERVEVEDVALLAWSSGGPTAYSCLLSKRSPFDKALIHGSIFPSDGIKLGHAKGKRFFLAQGEGDTITPVHHAERATEQLTDAGAGVVFEAYDGGHGWAMPEGSDAFLERALGRLFDSSAW